MFTKITFAALLGLLATGSMADGDVAQKFVAFKVQYRKSYPSAQEEAKRFKIFAANLAKADELARANPLARFGVNEFADLSATEFKTYHNAERAYQQHAKALAGAPTAQVPPRVGKVEKINWTKKGAVTGIKNQGQCGSCWSFSTTGNIEGQWFLAGNPLTSLSEQELVSCDHVDDACNGGLPTNAYKWLLDNKNGTIVTEASYPYVSGGGQVPACSLDGKKFGATIDGWENVKHNEPEMGDFLVARGPISIGLDATSFQSYIGGILTNCISQQVDHGVLIAGMDLTNKPPYWIVKNSWGPGWGEEGYIRIAYGTNQCLITTAPSSAKVASGGPTPSPVGPTPPPGPPGPRTFGQKHCRDAECTECSTETLPQGKCIEGAFGSYVAQCTSDSLLVGEYQSKDCTGDYRLVSNPINQCDIVFNAGGKVETFIMNECGAGPGPNPPTPTPPAPPAPTPTPRPTPRPSGTFTQMICQQPGCHAGCSNHTFPQDTCLRLNGGGSAKAECTATSLTLTEFPGSSSCTGQSIPETMPLDKCLQGNGGTYFENFCADTGATFSASAVQKPSQ